MFDKNYQYNVTFGADFLIKVSFTTNYSDSVLQRMDHEIPLKDQGEFFDNNIMYVDCNDPLCK